MENRQNKPPEGGAASGHGGQKFHTDSEQAKLHKSKLRMESREERLNKARERLAKQKPPKKPGPIKRIARIAGHETHAFLHGKVYQEERDNVGVEGGHFVERSGEAALHYGRHKVRRAIREHPAKAAARAESRYIKATADYHSRKFAQEQPEAQSAAARLWHRHKLKREYQRKARETAKQTAKAAEQTVSATERFVREAAAFVKRHPVGTLLALGCLLVVLTLQSCMSSMVSVGNSTLAAIAASTYKAEDADMLGAEAAYCALEDELQRYLDTYTRTHDYDEYHFDLDTIEHDPYVLLSIVCALHEGEWTLDEVRGTLQMLFDRQYILTEDVVVETRYRTETDTWRCATVPLPGRTARATTMRWRCRTTITSAMSRWKTSISPICPFTSWARKPCPGMPYTWRRWAIVPTCSRPRPMWASTPTSPRHMRSRRTILPMKPLPPF